VRIPVEDVDDGDCRTGLRAADESTDLLLVQEQAAIVLFDLR